MYIHGWDSGEHLSATPGRSTDDITKLESDPSMGKSNLIKDDSLSETQDIYIHLAHNIHSGYQVTETSTYVESPQIIGMVTEKKKKLTTPLHIPLKILLILMGLKGLCIARLLLTCNMLTHNKFITVQI